MDLSTPMADLMTIKLLLNSIISTPGAKFVTLDIKDFYLNIPMKDPEFLCMKLDHFPQDIIDNCELKEKADKKGYFYIHVKRACIDYHRMVNRQLAIGRKVKGI